MKENAWKKTAYEMNYTGVYFTLISRRPIHSFIHFICIRTRGSQNEKLIVHVTECVYSGRMYPALDKSPRFIRETPQEKAVWICNLREREDIWIIDALSFLSCHVSHRR